MPLPGNVSTVTLHGQYMLANGNAATGNVTFTQSSFIRNSGANVIIVPPSISVTLNGTGEFTVALIATDDPDLDPTGWTYRVSESISGSTRSYEIVLPAASPSVELADLAPTSPSGGIAWQYVLISEKGVSGGVATLDGTGKVPTAQIPSGAYILSTEKGAASGVATLDSGSKIPSAQIPSGAYILSTEKGAASGVATLDSSSRLLVAAAPLVALNAQTGTAYTAVLADHTKTIERSNVGANTCMMPSSTTAPTISVGWWTVVRMTNTGVTSITADSGVTVRCRGKTAPIALAGQWAAVTVTKRGTNEYTVDGDVA